MPESLVKFVHPFSRQATRCALWEHQRGSVHNPAHRGDRNGYKGEYAEYRRRQTRIASNSILILKPQPSILEPDNPLRLQEVLSLQGPQKRNPAAFVPQDPERSCGSDSLDVHTAVMTDVGYVGADNGGDGADGCR